MTDTLPDRGHNMPPDLLPILPIGPTEEALTAAAAQAQADVFAVHHFDAGAHAALKLRVEDFCDACGAWSDTGTISSQAQSERLTDFVTGSRALCKQVDEVRKAEKAPWDAGVAAVQTAFVPLMDKMEAVGKKMKAMQADWLQREERRIAAEKTEKARIAREAMEAAEREAAAAAARNDISGAVDAEAALKEAQKAMRAAEKPAHAQAGSATGAGRTMSMRTIRSAQINNVNALFLRYRAHPKLVECLQSLADADVRSKDLTEANAATFGVQIIERKVAA